MELIHESAGKKLYRDGDKLIKSFDESYSKANILNEALNPNTRAEAAAVTVWTANPWWWMPRAWRA